MVTDLAEIRLHAAEKEAENLAFRRHLSAHHHRIEEFQIIAEEVQQQIDCTQCANCCRHTSVSVTHEDIERISRRLDLTAEEVVHKYTTREPDAPALRQLASTSDGCVFLKGNLCSIYTARPKACREFPHIAPCTHSLGGRLESLCRHASLCPIIFNAIEQFKRVVGYR